MGTACDTWATGLSSHRGSPGDNGSFCPAHKFSGKERIPGPASPGCTMLLPGPHCEGLPWHSGSIQAPSLSHSFQACRSGKSEWCARHSAGGWESRLKHSPSQELCSSVQRKPKDLETLIRKSLRGHLCQLMLMRALPHSYPPPPHSSTSADYYGHKH